MYLYLSADCIGTPTGIGLVMHQELVALSQLGPVTAIVHRMVASPFDQDEELLEGVRHWVQEHGEKPRLAHAFSGCFAKTMGYLRLLGCKLTFTAATHKRSLAKREFECLDWKQPYDTWDRPELQTNISAVYTLADVVICPSRHVLEIAHEYNCHATACIPHGCELATVEPLPDIFTVGFLGNNMPEKGLVYLLQAWSKLDYQNAFLVLVGQGMTQLPVWHLARPYDKHGTVCFHPWTPDVDRFYAGISLYVQPSITECFGLPVLDAMAHGRAVLCSDGAGASDVVPETWRFLAGNVDALAEKIDQFRKADLWSMGQEGRRLAKDYEWPLIHQRYCNLWRSLL